MIQALQEALLQSQWVNDAQACARILHALGSAHLRLGTVEAAEEALDELEGLLLDGAAPEEQWRWHHLRSRILASVGDRRLAARALTRALELSDPAGRAEDLETLLEDARQLTANPREAEDAVQQQGNP